VLHHPVDAEGRQVVGQALVAQELGVAAQQIAGDRQSPRAKLGPGIDTRYGGRKSFGLGVKEEGLLRLSHGGCS
jgi:hypothetical protein